MFDSLLDYDMGTKLVPALADGMPSVSADGKAYTFKLQPGINFVKADGQRPAGDDRPMTSRIRSTGC